MTAAPHSIISWDISVQNAVKSITETDPQDICSYPIPALNSILGGIGKGEVVCVAGQSGEGKSDFLRLVGEHNAERGRRVHVYQFEMDADENTRRFILRKLNAIKGREKPITAVDLYFNRLTPWDHAELRKIVEEEAIHPFPLYTYSGQSLTISDFLQGITAGLSEIKPHLIVLDHIHYFAGDVGESENESISKAIREIRQWSKQTGIPIILAAHMRKPKKPGEDQTLHDIYGSSNIAKESTTCLILKRGQGETTFSVWKSRVGADYKRFEVQYDPLTKLWTGEAKNERTVFDSGFNDNSSSLPF